MVIISKIWETIKNNKIVSFVSAIVILYLLWLVFTKFFFRSKSESTQDQAERAATDAIKNGKTGTTPTATSAQAIADKARALSIALSTNKDLHVWETMTEDDEAAYNILSGLSQSEFKAIAEVYRTVFTENRDLKADVIRYLDDDYLQRLTNLLGGVSTVGFLVPSNNLNMNTSLDAIEKTL